jgi:hypothetical protein
VHIQQVLFVDLLVGLVRRSFDNTLFAAIVQHWAESPFVVFHVLLFFVVVLDRHGMLLAAFELLERLQQLVGYIRGYALRRKYTSLMSGERA